VPPIEPGDVITLQPATITRFDTAEPPQPSGEVTADMVTAGQLTIATARPFDPLAAAIANLAVGNDDAAPLLECVLVAPEIRTCRRTAFVDSTLAVRTPARAGRIEHGLRAYVAVEGGVAEMPRPLRAGDVLRTWPGCPKPRRAGLRPAESRWVSERGHAEILIIRGPHDAPQVSREWIVTPQLDRVGIRLRPVIASAFVPPADVPSCGMQPGTLQWHPDGSVVAMGPDHPITGGYLQPATIVSTDVWKLAYLQPGDRVTFVA
jgi:urea carboxylase